MTRPTKLTDQVSEIICQHARAGLPLRRAAALANVNRVTAWRWEAQGAAEIDQAPDDGAELGPHARFALACGQARAEYRAELTTAWKAAITRKDANGAKAVQVMLASVSPDEFSERRATRTIDQHTTMSGDVTVNRFASMSAEELDTERSKIAARIDAAQALGADDSWRAAAVRMPGQGTEEDRPESAVGENNSTAEKPKRSLSTRKLVGGLNPQADPGLSQENITTRARASNASVVDGPSVLVPGGSAPDHGEGGVSAGASPSPPLPASIDPAKFLAADDDEETKL